MLRGQDGSGSVSRFTLTHDEQNSLVSEPPDFEGNYIDEDDNSM
jgi:hypothetical protein